MHDFVVSPLTDFNVRLEGKHSSQDESSRLGDQGALDVPQEMQRIVAAVQQVQAADYIILETSVLPLIYSQQSMHNKRAQKSYCHSLLTENNYLSEIELIYKTAESNDMLKKKQKKHPLLNI